MVAASGARVNVIDTHKMNTVIQTAGTAFLKSKHLLCFAFEWQSGQF